VPGEPQPWPDKVSANCTFASAGPVQSRYWDR
jgi:hypothetical protein